MTALGSLKLSDDLAAGSQVVPSGTIVMYAGATAPSGWVICDGKAYDGANATYAGLWAVIGTTYGGTGQGSFRVPDLRARVPVGLSFKRPDESSGTPKAEVDALADSDGLSFYDRTVKHRHTISAQATGGMSANSTHSHGGATLSTDVQHAHTSTALPSHNHGGATVGAGTGVYVASASQNLGSIYNASGNGADGTIGLQGGSNYSLYRQGMGISVSLGDPGHAHTINGQSAGTPTINQTTAGALSHAHTIPTADLSHTHQFSGSAGDSALLTSESPAYLVVNFLVKL